MTFTQTHAHTQTHTYTHAHTYRHKSSVSLFLSQNFSSFAKKCCLPNNRRKKTLASETSTEKNSFFRDPLALFFPKVYRTLPGKYCSSNIDTGGPLLVRSFRSREKKKTFNWRLINKQPQPTKNGCRKKAASDVSMQLRPDCHRCATLALVRIPAFLIKIFTLWTDSWIHRRWFGYFLKMPFLTACNNFNEYIWLRTIGHMLLSRRV